MEMVCHSRATSDYAKIYMATGMIAEASGDELSYLSDGARIRVIDLLREIKKTLEEETDRILVAEFGSGGNTSENLETWLMRKEEKHRPSTGGSYRDGMG